MEVLTEVSRKAQLSKSRPRMAFGEVSIDVESRRVRSPAGASSLEPRVFDLLLTLVERPGLTASRDHLIETVWGQSERSDETLSQAVAKLRRALGDDARAPRFIETVPKLGYRWIFEDERGRPMPPAPRWSRGSTWVAASAMAAIIAGGAGGVGAYTRSKAAEPHRLETRKGRVERTADGRCLKRAEVLRGAGASSAADHAPPAPSSPGCKSAPASRLSWNGSRGP